MAATPSPALKPLTGNPLVDGLLSGAFWQLDASRTLTWAIADNPVQGFAWAFPAVGVSLIEAGLAEWAKVANINFRYAGYFSSPAGAPADIVFSWLDFAAVGAPGTPAAAVFPNPGFGNQQLAALGLTRAFYPAPEGDVFFDAFNPLFTSPAPGSLAFAIGMHEIGHALGLKHPHDGGFAPGYPSFAQLGLGTADIDYATLMSYKQTNPLWIYAGHPSTPMALDILAIQALYGPNLATNLGDTNYRLLNDGELRTVWDAGGSDTFDLTGAAVTGGLTIDLREGGLTKVSQISATWIAFGAVIENVRGTAFGDTIIGNAASNTLDGRQGNDTIIGGAGSGDTAVYTGLRSEFIITTRGKNTLVSDTALTLNQGTDTLSGIEWLRFSDVTIAVPHQVVDVFRFYNAGTGTHFYTGSETEKDAIIANPGGSAFLAKMNFEAAAYLAFAGKETGNTELFRFFNTTTGAHFFTAGAAEKDFIIANPANDPFLDAMILEGVAYYVLGQDGPNATEVWRFYNAGTGVHFYTASDAERNAIVTNASGDPFLAKMNLEGVGFWVPDALWGG